MSGDLDSSGKDRSTIHAKPFPKSTTESKIRELFQVYGSIRKIKLRREAVTNAFRGSVYVEFDSEAAASAAVSNPPSQPSTSERLHVMLKSEYEEKRALSNSSGQHSLSGQKRLKVDHHQGTPVSNHGDWQKPGDDKDNGVQHIEERLAKQMEEHQRLLNKLSEAQQRNDEAAARETAASQRMLAKDVEIGILKGEVASVRTQMQARIEQIQLQYKTKVYDLEIQLSRVKDELVAIKQAKERELKRETRARLTPTPADDGFTEDAL